MPVACTCTGSPFHPVLAPRAHGPTLVTTRVPPVYLPQMADLDREIPPASLLSSLH